MAMPITHERRGIFQRGGHCQALAFGGKPGGYVLIQRFSKINISLIESIAK